MAEATAGAKFAQLLQRIDPQSTLLHTWELKGGISAQVTGLVLEDGAGQMQKMIVRRHGAIDLKQNPQIAADEFRLLNILHARGLKTPLPHYFDQSNEIFSTPYIVIEYVEGETEATPATLTDLTLQLATQLTRIHSIDSTQQDLSFLPLQESSCTCTLQTRPVQVDDALDEGHIRAVLEAAWPLPQRNASVLLHGDFWPGNVLWKDEQLVAVIDWEDAKLGDPLADLANSRLEILWAFGADAMQSFTSYYAALNTIDFTDLPYWDLYAALRPIANFTTWAADTTTEKSMRAGHKLFITQAYEKLATSD